MTTRILAGAPFDKGNFFTKPALDAGPINNTNEFAVLYGIDGGDFNGIPPSTPLHDGGSIPPAGTASFDPTKTYGPNDIITNVLDLLDEH